jgi:ribosomal protein S14
MKYFSLDTKEKLIIPFQSIFRKRKACLFCPLKKSIIRSYSIGVCRNCFRDNHKDFGFSVHNR